MGQEIEPFSISLKIPSQCIMGGVVGSIRVKVVEGKILVLGEGLGRDDVGGFKDAGVAFFFGIDPVAAYGVISVKGYRIKPLVQQIFKCSNARRACADNGYFLVHGRNFG